MTDPRPDDLPPPVGDPTPVGGPAEPDLVVASGLPGLLELCVAVVTTPGRAFDEVVRRSPLAWSIGVVLVANALTATTQMASASGSLGAVSSSAPLGSPGVGLSGTASLLAGVLVGAPFGLAVTAVWTAVVLLFARMLGGTGGYRVTFCGLAFASVPQVITVVVTGVTLPMGALGTVLGVLTAFGVGVWTVVLCVVAVRRAHDLSTGRAVGAVLLPVVAVMVVLVLVVVALVGIVVSTLS